MTSILKADNIQDADGNNIINESSNTITIGASGDTISIPSGATIANSGTATGFGKIGQVVTHSLNTVQTISTTGSYQPSGLTLNITPSASSSTIFLLATIQYSTNAADYNGSFSFFRDSTIIGAAADSSNRIGSMSMGRGDSSYSRPVPLSFIDSPSTTSQITYTVKFYPEAGATHYLNRTGADADQAHKGRSASTLTAFEVLA